MDIIQMQVQQQLLDTFDSITSDGGEVGYIDSKSSDMFINARVILAVAKIIKHQGDTSINEDIKFMMYAAALAVAEAGKMTHSHISQLDVDTMFD